MATRTRRPQSRHARAWRQASSMTQLPSVPIRPKRSATAIVSPTRDSLRRRSPTWRSTASPLLCPWESLIGLKPSRSMNSTASLAAARSTRATAAASLSSNTSRLGSCVRAS